MPRDIKGEFIKAILTFEWQSADKSFEGDFLAIASTEDQRAKRNGLK